MAMRRFSREEFWLQLEKRGCHCVSEEDDLGSIWLVLMADISKSRRRMRTADIPIGCSTI
jgi:hypothetical protein